jgi:hypothetical protein
MHDLSTEKGNVRVQVVSLLPNVVRPLRRNQFPLHTHEGEEQEPSAFYFDSDLNVPTGWCSVANPLSDWLMERFSTAVKD